MLAELWARTKEKHLPLPATQEWGEGGAIEKRASSPQPSPPLGEERESVPSSLIGAGVKMHHMMPPIVE
jgi:hypothetical protein